ncbi:putative colanic acid biosynthesis acetyltransferase WcaF [Runella defluvii]|uniref:Putative colanic acid biosynthesis acetyltransferase WcaF n=1 Tax=Runella defluvii TaxID=370973 RepID=A0A7W5ZIL1_9BACT|nr:WcaF family extracellular polysaccharide biosynthesis acetyltransferase [Runella defluvii]MBB3836411.1 putative colanic acid biosynthesis acetyltransferase WcaF [Runella defluvii]
MHNLDTFSGPSFSIKNRLLRVIWNCVYFLFFSPTPPPFHVWRSAILRLFGAKIGKGVHIYPKVKIWAPWNLEVGDQTGIANGVILYCQGKISIGKRSVISQGCHLCSGTHDYNQIGFPLVTKPISIGNYVWVAAESFIHPGINIGDGCVIGARSVVIKDLKEWMVYSGHPCMFIKSRKKIY